MKQFALLLLLACASLASADTPTNVLPQLDQYLGPQSYVDSFKTGDTYVVRFDEKFNNLTSDMTTKEEVEALADRVKFTLRGSDDRIFRIDELTKINWEGFGGNFVRPLVDQIQSFGFKIDMQVADFTEVRLMVNNRPARVSAIKVLYTGVNGIGAKLEGELYITNQLPARGQILIRKENQAGILRQWTVQSFNRP